MPKKINLRIAWFAAALAVLPWTQSQSLAKPGQAPDRAMAPLSQFMMPENVEAALARSAAPKSISDDARVMVLGPHGYKTVANGSNGFLCIVERSWARPTDDPGYWDPKMSGPVCYNAAAAKTFEPLDLMKTRLVLEGKPKAEIAKTIASALDKNELPALGPGAMCYMLSKQQYFDDKQKNWHPHSMFFAPGDAAKTWGANLPGSPILAAYDPQTRVTIFMVWADHWSDGTPYSPGAQ